MTMTATTHRLCEDGTTHMHVFVEKEIVPILRACSRIMSARRCSLSAGFVTVHGTIVRTSESFAVPRSVVYCIVSTSAAAASRWQMAD